MECAAVSNIIVGAAFGAVPSSVAAVGVMT
jgi:hypothetical protein